MNAFSDYHKKYIIKIGAIISISSMVIIGLNFYSIRILSSIRAYVNGESEYSKGQKEAVRYLTDFIQTSDFESYRLFKQELAVPVADSVARIALQKGKPDSVIRKAFLEGRNHPDDIGNLIWLFEKSKNFPFFGNVIDRWAAADRDIGELDRIGDFIYNLRSDQLNPAVAEAMILNVNTINRRLTYNQQSFSTNLGKTSRLIAIWLFIINVFFILFILITAGIFAKNTFKKLVESQRLIMAQNNAKDEFMSIASHELKTPITSMKASLQILERFTKENPEANKMHPFIINSNKQVNRLSNLVKELLDVTRIQSGKLEIAKKTFLFNELIKDVVDETTQSSQHSYFIEDLPEIYVYADSNRIYQVIDNFLSNAAKYSSPGKQINLWIELKDDVVKLCVKDFGPGIPREKIPLLFDRFYRIEETSQTIQGLGLGLYICKEIIRNHNGDIGAESELGKGSVFWFTLPLDKEEIVSSNELTYQS